MSGSAPELHCAGAVQLADLIGGLTSTSPMFSLPKERQFFDRLRARLAEAVPSNQTPDTLNGDGLPATAPTARELELLRLIERGFSNERARHLRGGALRDSCWVWLQHAAPLLGTSRSG